MKLKEHDLIKSISQIGNIPEHTNGTIVHIYNEVAFEVEFFDKNGNTIGVKTVNKKDLIKRDTKLKATISLLAGFIGMMYSLYHEHTIFASLFLAIIMISNYVWIREKFAKETSYEGYWVIVPFVFMWGVLQTLLILAVTYLK